MLDGLPQEVRIELRQLQHRLLPGLVAIRDLSRSSAQFVPPFAGGVRSMRYVAQQAEPFDQGPLDVASTELGVLVVAIPGPTRKEFRDDFGRAFPVGGGNPEAQVAGKLRRAVGLAAGQSEPFTGRILERIRLETVSGPKIHEVGHDVFDRIGIVLQGGGDGEAFPLMKVAEDEAAQGWAAIGFDQPALPNNACMV